MKRFFLLSFSILLPLALMELAFRVLDIPVSPINIGHKHFMHSKIPGVPFTYKSNIHKNYSGITIQTNSLGLKELTEPNHNPDQCRRILIVGGSFTAGYGVEFNKSFPRQLEVLLNSNGRPCYQVINGGQISFSTQNITALSAALIEKYQPMLIVHVINRFAMNDSSSLSKNGLLLAEGAQSDWLTNQWQTPKSIIEKHLNIYRFFQPRIQVIAKQLLGKRSNCPSRSCLQPGINYTVNEAEYDHLLTYSPLFFSPTRLKKLYGHLNESIDLAKQKKIPLFMMSINFFVDSEKLAPYPQLHLRDLSTVVKLKNNDFLDNFSLQWDFHFSPEGNARIANGLAKMLTAIINHPNNTKPNSQEYLTEKRQALLNYNKHFSEYLDFKKQVGIHQIIGGLMPPQKQSVQTISIVLNTSGKKSFMIRGKLSFSRTAQLKISLADHLRKESYLIELSDSSFAINYRPKTNFQGLVDIDITCLNTSCENVEYDFIGFE